MIENVLWYYTGLALSLTIGFSIYGIASRPHLVKKMALFTILGDAIYVLLVYLGYTLSSTTPPVYPGGSIENPVLPMENQISMFSARSVDPVPQVLIVTAIVIGLSVLLLIASISLRIAREYGSLITTKLKEAGSDE
ncbi:sodium:proton antiporter [Thermosphaera sp.]|uniref:Na+/H+ antiporter subunit C n=1 Tax=Thermosphaera aggregans TaxID=54254 RepID=A0A7C2BLH8_9CREN